MFELYDILTGKIVSKHRSMAAAVAAQARLHRQREAAVGSGSLARPSLHTVVQEDGESVENTAEYERLAANHEWIGHRDSRGRTY